MLKHARRRASGVVLAALVLLAAILFTAGRAGALGFILGQSKDELKLKYDVSVYDHQTGRVTVTIKIADDGRLKPIDSVDFHIPSTEKHADGVGTKSDLSLSLATRQDGGHRVASVHLRKEWAERAEIWLTTTTFDGKRAAMERMHHVIPVAPFVKTAEEKKR